MTLRARLGVALGAVLIVLLVAGLLVPRAVRAAQLEQIDRQLEVMAPSSLVLTSIDRPAEFPAGQLPPAAFSEIYVAVVAADGTRDVLASPQQVSEGAEPAKVPPASHDPRTLDTKTVGSTSGSGEWRAATLGPGPGQSSTVLIAIPLDRVNETIRRLRLTLLAAGGAVALVLTLAGWWVVRLGLRPIADVAEVADAITRGERHRRVSAGAPGTEVAHLARAFNVMLDERAASEARLRQFVGDASHELRTPVTAIRGFTDLYRQGVLDDQGLADAMRRIGQETARMGALIDDLLLLARLDEGRPLDRVPVDLSGMLADAVLDAGATHPSRAVRCETVEPLFVIGDGARLHQVIANLVTNALVHTDSDVVLRGRHADQGADGMCVIEISDSGQGMDAASAAHAFDRFWRGDSGRGRHGAGAGLGLSIVRSIIDAHGGRVALESAPGRGTTVRIVLPSGPQETHKSP
jgi:two-component system, OmpR family, sensor kinase